MPKALKTRKRRGKDLDEIADDMQPAKATKLLKEQPVDFDLPGCGQFYCLECGRYLANEQSLTEHKRSKVHKQRVKMLKKTAPYSQKEAEAAAGLGSYAKPFDATKHSGKDKAERMVI